MSKGEDDVSVYDTKWFRTLVVSALLSGLGSGYSTLNSDTSDRYKGADAARDLATRDARIAEIKRRLDIEEDRRVAHLAHSATYTQIIVEATKDIEKLESRIDRLEQWDDH